MPQSKSPKRKRSRARGQSLVEFAIMLPALLLIVLLAVDFGRAFYSWVTLTNAARDGANFAGSFPGTPLSDIQARMNADGLDALTKICPSTISNPVFADGPDPEPSTAKDIGDKVTVGVRCDFKIITPVIGAILGNNVQMSSSATYPVRTGADQ